MLKATGRTAEGEAILLLGLSWENLDRLRAGEPIRFSLRELGLPDGQVLIQAGETLLHIAKEWNIPAAAVVPFDAANDSKPAG